MYFQPFDFASLKLLTQKSDTNSNYHSVLQFLMASEPINLTVPADKALELFKTQAEKLYNIIMQKKIPEEPLCSLLKHHNWIQRIGILTAYKQLYKDRNDDFFTIIDQKLSKDLLSIVKYSFCDRYELWAELISNELNSKKQNLLTISTYILLQNDDDTERIDKVLGMSQAVLLEKKLDSKFKATKVYPLLTGVLNNQTVKNFRVDEALDALHKAAKGYGVNEDVFVEILTTTSYPNIKDINERLMKEGSSLPEVVGKEFEKYKQKDSDAYGAFKTICLYNLDPPRAVARLLKKSKNSTLDIALTVLFSDYMKEEVVEKYKKYGVLAVDIKKEIQSRARIFMSALWGIDSD